MDGGIADHRNGRAGEGTPVLDLDGYSGPLEQLLVLARAHEIDLTRLPLVALVDQLATALQHAPPATPLGQKGDWVVMEAIRSRVRRGLAWGCTFVASLELAKQGDLTLAQEGLFEPIHVKPPAALPPP